MLKFTDTQVVFSELPDEISLAVNISGCPCACEGCHSAYLAEDIGELLTIDAVDALIDQNAHISCLLFMGGDRDPAEINRLATHIRQTAPTLKIGWYSGRQELSLSVSLDNLDYIKLGPYISSLGPLTSPTTNQKLYKIVQVKSKKKLVNFSL